MNLIYIYITYAWDMYIGWLTVSTEQNKILTRTVYRINIQGSRNFVFLHIQGKEKNVLANNTRKYSRLFTEPMWIPLRRWYIGLPDMWQLIPFAFRNSCEAWYLVTWGNDWLSKTCQFGYAAISLIIGLSDAGITRSIGAFIRLRHFAFYAIFKSDGVNNTIEGGKILKSSVTL